MSDLPSEFKLEMPANFKVGDLCRGEVDGRYVAVYWLDRSTLVVDEEERIVFSLIDDGKKQVFIL